MKCLPLQLKEHLRRWVRSQVRAENDNLKSYIDWSIRSDYLGNQAIHCSESGITSRKLCDEEVIVSLTTHGKRLHEVNLSIESIMQGTVKPNRIVLWLPENLKAIALPQTLKNQQQRGLQIEYCRDIGPYTKLIYALKAFPEACIITIDDDAAYYPDVVENLVNAHIRNPNCVCANRIHTIRFDGKKLKSYVEWDLCSACDTPDIRHFATGAGGVLYFPHAFPEEVFNEKSFLNICAKADDVWFNAMLLLNNTRIVKSFTHSQVGRDFLDNPEELEVGLCCENFFSPHCMNDVYLDAVWNKYGLYRFFEN